MPTGSATDVPELLRGLLTDDAPAREIALDGLYGAVHHQGDIYHRTLACVPSCSRRWPTCGCRIGVASWPAASIGGADMHDQDDTGIAEEDQSPWHWNFRLAQQAVLVGYPTFLGLLADSDSKVRRQAPRALLAC